MPPLSEESVFSQFDAPLRPFREVTPRGGSPASRLLEDNKIGQIYCPGIQPRVCSAKDLFEGLVRLARRSHFRKWRPQIDSQPK